MSPTLMPMQLIPSGPKENCTASVAFVHTPTKTHELKTRNFQTAGMKSI